MDFRAQINSVEGYQSAIEQANLQISMMNIAIERIVDIGSEVSGSAKGTEYDITSDNQSVAQKTARTLAKEMLSLLDSEVDGDYVFSGKTSDVEPVLSYQQIVHGQNGEDGLLVVTDERIRADAGADGRGRVALSNVANNFTITEEATDFGVKLNSVSNSLQNVAVTGPTGAPASISIDVTGKPAVGEVLSVTLNMPDGSHEVIELVASDGITTPGEGKFSISGSDDDIAAAIQSEFALQLEKTVATSGEASSRIQAAKDMFLTAGGAEPKRVVGSPPETATTLDTATAAGKPTVQWYVGDNDGQPSRETATARVDSRLDVSYGARANEDSIATQLSYMMAFSLPNYELDSSLDKNRYAEFADAISSGLSSSQKANVVKTIGTEIGVASKVMNDAKTRHTTSLGTLMTMRDGVEGINKEEVAAKIMTIRNTIDASYQATSMLYNLSLTKYI